MPDQLEQSRVMAPRRATVVIGASPNAIDEQFRDQIAAPLPPRESSHAEAEPSNTAPLVICGMRACTVRGQGANEA